MARTYDAIDFFWSYDGDLAMDDRGDIQDTSFDSLRCIHQQILQRIRGSTGDLQYNPDLAANLDRFVGKKNTRSAGIDIKSSIRNALLYRNLVDGRDLNVKVAPISPSIIAGKVSLAYQQTRANLDSLPVTLSFLYDYKDNNIYPVDNKYSKE